jgi:hypothetical protein
MEQTPPSEPTASPNLQEAQDDYSIPDDDLRSESSLMTEQDESAITFMEDDEHTQEGASDSVDGGTGVISGQESSTSAQWTTFTTRKQHEVAKKHKPSTNIDVDQLHKDGMRDLAFCKLRKSGIDEISMACTSLGGEENSPARKVKSQKSQSRQNMPMNLEGAERHAALQSDWSANDTSTRNPVPTDNMESSFNNHTGTTVLPSISTVPENNDTTFYTYRAQLTFGLTKKSDDINVAKYFNRWIFSSCESLEHFSLIPYEDEKGQQINSMDQVPENNAEFYSAYYHNHRVLSHGNLTGMVAFQSSIPWSKLKSPNFPFFNWLKMNKLFLNQLKFKASSLIPCGFLIGAHPGHLRRDEAEDELRVSLGYPITEELPFQLSSRSVSVPIQEGKPDRYVFQAVVIETSVQHAASLREKFYALGNPAKAAEDYPYTGKYQFVPFLKTKEWTIAKILRLAKLHVKIVQDLRVIFLINLQNIHNQINHDGITLMQGFYGMQFKYPTIE